MPSAKETTNVHQRILKKDYKTFCLIRFQIAGVEILKPCQRLQNIQTVNKCKNCSISENYEGQKDTLLLRIVKSCAQQLIFNHETSRNRKICSKSRNLENMNELKVRLTFNGYKVVGVLQNIILKKQNKKMMKFSKTLKFLFLSVSSQSVICLVLRCLNWACTIKLLRK